MPGTDISSIVYPQGSSPFTYPAPPTPYPNPSPSPTPTPTPDATSTDWALIGALIGVGVVLIVALAYGLYKCKNNSQSDATGVVYGEAGSNAFADGINAPDEQPLNSDYEAAE